MFQRNKLVNKFLLAGDKFIPKLHLRQPRFTYSAYGPFPKALKRIQKFRRTGNLKDIYKNKLDKACFAHDAAYSDSKDLTKITASDKILKGKAYEVARNSKHDGYQKSISIYSLYVLRQ